MVRAYRCHGKSGRSKIIQLPGYEVGLFAVWWVFGPSSVIRTACPPPSPSHSIRQQISLSVALCNHGQDHVDGGSGVPVRRIMAGRLVLQ